MRTEASVEEMHEHWRKMVRAHLDMLTGIVTVQVRAFSRDDAYKVANAIVARADEMFVKMTERARRDSLKFAEAEVARAEEAARVARAELREFREIQKVFDPNRNAQGNVELTNRLREELARLNMQVATMTTYLAPNAPQIQLLRTQIASLVQQIKQIEGSIGTDRDNNSGPVVPATLAKFEALTAAVQFAEKAHAAALDSLQRARAAADRRTTYLSVFVQPTMAEIALYPERPLAILLVALAATAIWMVGLLGFSTVRDHLL
jgi:capsular polysaccharide transport system permease protein